VYLLNLTTDAPDWILNQIQFKIWHSIRLFARQPKNSTLVEKKEN